MTDKRVRLSYLPESLGIKLLFLFLTTVKVSVDN